jgi:hypothetical protein
MALSTRARAAVFKAACMGAFGLFVLGKSLWNLQTGLPPEPAAMGSHRIHCIGGERRRGADALRFPLRGREHALGLGSCSRNDAWATSPWMLAALGVFGTGSAWPDLLVAP